MGANNMIDSCFSFSFFPNVLTFSYSFLGLSLPFLASFVPLPPVALIIPIFYDCLIDNLSTSQAPPARERFAGTEKPLINHHPAASMAFHIKLPQIVPLLIWLSIVLEATFVLLFCLLSCFYYNLYNLLSFLGPSDVFREHREPWSVRAERAWGARAETALSPFFCRFSHLISNKRHSATPLQNDAYS